MLFRFIISDPFEGAMRGTNNEKTARSYADCEDYYVVDTATGLWLQPDGIAEEVTDIDPVEDDNG